MNYIKITHSSYMKTLPDQNDSRGKLHCRMECFKFLKKLNNSALRSMQQCILKRLKVVRELAFSLHTHENSSAKLLAKVLVSPRALGPSGFSGQTLTRWAQYRCFSSRAGGTVVSLRLCALDRSNCTVMSVILVWGRSHRDWPAPVMRVDASRCKRASGANTKFPLVSVDK